MKPSQLIKLSELAEYQQDAIVSNLLINAQAGSVTFFAFDKGQCLSEHTAPFDALVIGVEGKAEISIAGTIYNVNQGDTLLMPAHKPHAVKALEQWKMILVMIRDVHE